MQEHQEATTNCQLPLSATVSMNSSSCSLLELLRIINDAVAARWRQLVAEVELGGEYLAVCLQHLQASWKEALHVQPREGAGGEEALGVHLQEWVQLRTGGGHGGRPGHGHLLQLLLSLLNLIRQR